MKVTEICTCGSRQVTEVPGHRKGESYSVPGICLKCAELAARETAVDEYMEKKS